MKTSDKISRAWRQKSCWNKTDDDFDSTRSFTIAELYYITGISFPSHFLDSCKLKTNKICIKNR